MSDLFETYDAVEWMRLCVYDLVVVGLTLEDVMADFKPTKAQADAVVAALDMKIASLRRAQKGASSSFNEVYEAEIRMYNSLIDLVRGSVK